MTVSTVYIIKPLRGQPGTGGRTTDRQVAYNARQHGHEVVAHVTIDGVDVEEVDE